jgi:hypothetical protein
MLSENLSIELLYAKNIRGKRQKENTGRKKQISIGVDRK